MTIKNKEEFFREQIVPLEEELGFYILSKVKNAEDTAEIRQIAFMYAWKGLHRLREPKNVRAWMYKIVKNCIKEYWRSKLTKERRIYIEYYEAEELDIENLAGQEESILHDVIERFEGEQAYKALLLLNEEERIIMTLRYVEELRIKEIAAIIGIKEKTVSSRLCRILKKYREIYFKLEEGRL